MDRLARGEDLGRKARVEDGGEPLALLAVAGDECGAKAERDGNVHGIAAAKPMRGRDVRGVLGHDRTERDERELRATTDFPGELLAESHVVPSPRDRRRQFWKEQRRGYQGR